MLVAAQRVGFLILANVLVVKSRIASNAKPLANSNAQRPESLTDRSGGNAVLFSERGAGLARAVGVRETRTLSRSTLTHV